MKSILVALLLIGVTSAQDGIWYVKPNLTSLRTDEFGSLIVLMDETVTVPVTVYIPESGSVPVKLQCSNEDTDVATVDVPSVPDNWSKDSPWTTHFNVTGKFLGNTLLSFEVFTENNFGYRGDVVNVAVIRGQRLIDILFVASVATLVSILYINFGCAMDWSVCRNTMKRPVGPAIGAFCQIIIMPVLSYIIGQLLFPERPELQIGIFFTGISPSGGASNIWTVLLGGNLNLSVTMTTLTTMASFATIPIWIFTLGARIFDKGNLVVPYARIAMLAFGLVIPLGVGFLIQKKFPKLCRILVRIMKPFSVVLILFIIIFAIVANSYLFKLFSWQIIVAGMGLAWIGYICGWIAMIIFRQPNVDVRAIAIETGIQNTGIAIFLLQFSLRQPAADLTTVIPVSCAIMTPIPLTILWLIKLAVDRKKKLAASMEKLQNIEEPVNAITPTSQSTILQ